MTQVGVEAFKAVCGPYPDLRWAVIQCISTIRRVYVASSVISR